MQHEEMLKSGRYDENRRLAVLLGKNYGQSNDVREDQLRLRRFEQSRFCGIIYSNHTLSRKSIAMPPYQVTDQPSTPLQPSRRAIHASTRSFIQCDW